MTDTRPDGAGERGRAGRFQPDQLHCIQDGVSCLTFLPAAPPPVHLWVSCRVISWCHHSRMFRPLPSTSPGGGAVAYGGRLPATPCSCPHWGTEPQFLSLLRSHNQ